MSSRQEPREKIGTNKKKEDGKNCKSEKGQDLKLTTPCALYKAVSALLGAWTLGFR